VKYSYLVHIPSKISPSLNQSDSNGKSHADILNNCSFLHKLDVYCAGYRNDSAFCCVDCHRVITRHSNEPNRNMANEIQQNEWDNQPSEFRNIEGPYKHIFFLLLCILPPTSIYNLLLGAYELLTTLSLLFVVPLPVRTPCISLYTISSKAMSSQLAALALWLQYNSCDTVCAGTGTVSGHVQIYCRVLG